MSTQARGGPGWLVASVGWESCWTAGPADRNRARQRTKLRGGIHGMGTGAEGGPGWSLQEGQGSWGWGLSSLPRSSVVEGTGLWPALVVPVPSKAAPEHAAFPALRGVGTCAQEKHLIAPVCRIHLVDGHSGEAVVDVGADHQRPAVRGVDSVVHQWVRTHEVDHFIRVVLGRLHGWGEGPPGAL